MVCVAGDLIKDKDGISAAAVFYEMAATLQREDNLSVAQVGHTICGVLLMVGEVALKTLCC